jgi:hypothetical protein
MSSVFMKKLGRKPNKDIIPTIISSQEEHEIAKLIFILLSSIC